METLITEQTNRESISLHLRGQVLSEMDHAYLNRWIGLPDPELFQLTAALAILQTAGCSKAETELVTTVLLLIYHGLSIHEHIDEFNVNEVRPRQLRVLAGDYYSSKYFYLLAFNGKIDLIGLFAEAITRINEAKVEYNNLISPQQNIDHYLQIFERVEGELLFLLAKHYLHNQPMITDTFRLLIRCYIWGISYQRFTSNRGQDRLSMLYLLEKATDDERKTVLSNQTMPDSKVVSLHVKYGTSSFLYSQFQSSLTAVKSLLTLQNSIELAKNIENVCNYLQQTYMDPQRIVEER